MRDLRFLLVISRASRPALQAILGSPRPAVCSVRFGCALLANEGLSDDISTRTCRDDNVIRIFQGDRALDYDE